MNIIDSRMHPGPSTRPTASIARMSTNRRSKAISWQVGWQVTARRTASRPAANAARRASRSLRVAQEATKVSVSGGMRRIMSPA